MTRYVPLIYFLIALSAGSVWFSACEDDSSDKSSGLGITNDVGDECQGLCDDGDWCFDSNLPWKCVSSFCVGRSMGDMYCTQLCGTDYDCPEGYRCTWNCELDSSDQAYCVKEDDYGYLVAQGYCY